MIVSAFTMTVMKRSSVLEVLVPRTCFCLQNEFKYTYKYVQLPRITLSQSSKSMMAHPVLRFIPIMLQNFLIILLFSDLLFPQFCSPLL